MGADRNPAEGTVGNSNTDDDAPMTQRDPLIMSMLFPTFHLHLSLKGAVLLAGGYYSRLLYRDCRCTTTLTHTHTNTSKEATDGLCCFSLHSVKTDSLNMKWQKCECHHDKQQTPGQILLYPQYNRSKHADWEHPVAHLEVKLVYV